MDGSVNVGVEPTEIKRLPFKQLAKRIGPGIIMCGMVVGPGTITTAAMLGARYGYMLLWLVFPIILMATTFMLISYRVILITGMPIVDAIRHYYGKTAAIIVGIALFISGCSFTIGNVSGTGIGMNLVFGINWKIGALIACAAVLIVYFSRGVYTLLEKIVTVCVVVMIVCFFITVVGTGGPDLGETAKGFVLWKFPALAALPVALGFISTNANAGAAVYATYLGKEKKWRIEDMFNGVIVTDVLTHIISVAFIGICIILTGAIVLHPAGTVIKGPAQLAELLVPIMGGAAKYIMGLAILGAGFSSLIGATQRTAVLLLAAFGKPYGLETKLVRWFSLGVLLFGIGFSLFYGSSPTQLVLIANICTAVATPFAGLFLLLLVFRKDIGAQFKRPRVLQVCICVSYILVIAITGNTIRSIILSFA